MRVRWCGRSRRAGGTTEPTPATTRQVGQAHMQVASPHLRSCGVANTLREWRPVRTDAVRSHVAQGSVAPSIIYSAPSATSPPPRPLPPSARARGAEVPRRARVTRSALRNPSLLLPNPPPASFPSRSARAHRVRPPRGLPPRLLRQVEAAVVHALHVGGGGGHGQAVQGMCVWGGGGAGEGRFCFVLEKQYEGGREDGSAVMRARGDRAVAVASSSSEGRKKVL